MSLHTTCMYTGVVQSTSSQVGIHVWQGPGSVVPPDKLLLPETQLVTVEDSIADGEVVLGVTEVVGEHAAGTLIQVAQLEVGEGEREGGGGGGGGGREGGGGGGREGGGEEERGGRGERGGKK